MPQRQKSRTKKQAKGNPQTKRAPKPQAKNGNVNRPRRFGGRRPNPTQRRVAVIKHPMLHYSPFHNKGHISTSHANGESTPIESILNFSITHGVGYEGIMLFSWTPTVNLVHYFNKSVSSGADVLGIPFYASQLGALASNQPLSIKPIRNGLRLMNTTAALTIEGIVYATPVLAPLQLNFAANNPGDQFCRLSAADFTSLASFIIGNKHSRRILHKDLSKHSFVNVPLSETAYETFYDFVERDTTDETVNVDFETIYNQLEKNAPMTKWLIYFPPVGNGQNMSLQINRIDACKYPLNTALNTTSTTPPRITAETHKTNIANAHAVLKQPNSTKEAHWYTPITTAIANSASSIGQDLVKVGERAVRSGIGSVGRAAYRAISAGAEVAEEGALVAAAVL